MNKRSRSIVHIATTVYGGAGRAAYRLHEALLEEHISSSFVTLDTDFPPGAINCYSYIHTIPPFHKRVINRLKREWAARFSTKSDKGQTADLIKQWSYIIPKLKCEAATMPFSNPGILTHPVVQSADLINLHWINGIIDYPSFFDTCDKPVVWTLHDMNPFNGIFHYKDDEQYNEQIASAVDRQVRIVKRKSYERLKTPMQIVTPSVWLSNEAAASDLLKGFPVVTIPYSLDLDVFAPGPYEEIRKKLDLPTDRFVILFIDEKSQKHRKGLDLLFDALQKILHLPITVIALGNSLQKNWGKVDIRFAGVVKDNKLLAEYYSAANVFVLPSREDNLPNVMLESFACGTPVVGFAVGGIKEHVINFKTGMLADALTSESLAAAILALYNDYQAFSRTFIRDYASQHFNNKMQASGYIDIYNKLLS